MVSLLVDVHLSKAKLTLFHDGNCVSFASTVHAYSLRQILLRVVTNGTTSSLGNALYDHCSSRFEIAFQGIRAETNPNIRQRFHMLWWNSEVSKSLAASLVRFVCHSDQYGLSGMWNKNILSKLTFVFARLLCLFRITKVVSSTVELVNVETSGFVNWFNFATWAFASKCFPIELDPCSDGWRRTW